MTDLVFDLQHNRVHRVIVGDARLTRASALLGGAVAEVVLDAFWGDVAFAAVEISGALRPVPLDAFALRDGEPVLRVARHNLRALPGFSHAQLDAHLADRAFLQRNARLAHRQLDHGLRHVAPP